MTNQRRPFWPLLIAVLVGLPVLYVASFGPACWILSRLGNGKGVAAVVYGPLLPEIVALGPRELSHRTMLRYGELFEGDIPIAWSILHRIEIRE